MLESQNQSRFLHYNRRWQLLVEAYQWMLISKAVTELWVGEWIYMMDSF